MNADTDKLIAEARGPNPYYTPTIMAAFKAYKEAVYGGKLGDEPFKLGSGEHSEEPYYTAMALEFRLFKAGAEWMDKFCAEHSAERYQHCLADALSLHAEKPKPAREDAQPYKDALHDLVMLKAQQDIGCVPAPTSEQWKKAWAAAEDLLVFEP